MADLSLRPVEGRDEGLLRLVYAESRREELEQAAWPEGALDAFLRLQFDAQASHYHQHYPGAQFQIVELAGEPIGRLHVLRGQDEIRVIDIALLPAVRGKGIGTTLLEEILAEAQSAGKFVSIHVEKYNPALRLYQRLGFQPVEDRNVYWLMHWRAAS